MGNINPKARFNFLQGISAEMPRRPGISILPQSGLKDCQDTTGGKTTAVMINSGSFKYFKSYRLENYIWLYQARKI